MPPFCSRPCFILAQKVCAKLCFCILCLWMGLSNFQDLLGGKGMFLRFNVFIKQACGQGLRQHGDGQTLTYFFPIKLPHHFLFEQVVRCASSLKL